MLRINNLKNLSAISQLRYGQETEVFRRYPEPARSHLSFSLIYSEEGEQRTLDLTCDSERDFEYWYFGIKVQSSCQTASDAQYM